MRAALLAALFVIALPLFLAGAGRNPPGFFIDEASISYNAWIIATTGADEFGVRWPLFFKSTGEYKNPVYIYLLALVFKIFGPSVTAARALSALLADAAATAFSALALLIGGRRWIAVATFLLASATATVFEIGHLVFEVAVFPLLLALFLIALWKARDEWRASHVIAVSVTLALITYAYTAGRILGPLLAIGLILFGRTRPILATWALYALLALIPMAAFHFTHDRALSARFEVVRLQSSGAALFGDFLANYAANADPVGESLIGDPNERHHVWRAGGNILAATFLLAGAGAIAAVRRRDPWHKFLLYGLAVSLVPASLTSDTLHMLRLVPYVAFLFALSIEGMSVAPRALLAIAFLAALIQAAWFFHAWTTESATRQSLFDCCVPPVLDSALAAHRLPIYVQRGFSANVFWFAMLRGVDRNAFVVGNEPPPGAIGMTALQPPAGSRVLARNYLVFAYERR